MKFLTGFKWAVPAAFSDAVFLCCFEEGDILYDTPHAYKDKWNDNKNNIQYFLQVRYPVRGSSLASDAKGVFETNWNSEVRIELYKNHEMVNVGQIHTTQGKLYTALWKGDISLLNSDSKNPTLPVNIQHITKNLECTSEIVKKHSKGAPTFVMAKDDTNPITREKYLKIKNALSKYLIDEPVILPPSGAGFENPECISPTIQIAIFITEKISANELMELVKKQVYVQSKDAKTDRFRISAHGIIFPDNPIFSFIYKDAEDVTLKHNIAVTSITDTHIEGRCQKSNKFKTFRKDRIIEYITDINAVTIPSHHIKKRPRPQKNTIHFTEFKEQDKYNIAKLAEQNDIIVRKSVTKNLTYLCYGNCNSGSHKFEPAKKEGAIILSEKQFRAMLETGELPEK